MAITTYAELKEAVASHLARSDLTAYMADFVTLAEGYLNTETRLRVREAETETSLTPTDNVCTLPTDYGVFREVWAQTSPVCELRLATPEFARERYSGLVSSGYPEFFTIVGTELTAYPLASADIGLIYYKKAAALSDSNTTNWLLTAFPHVYYYATLIQSAPFTANMDRVGIWGQMLDTALNAIESNDKQARFAKIASRPRGITP